MGASARMEGMQEQGLLFMDEGERCKRFMIGRIKNGGEAQEWRGTNTQVFKPGNWVRHRQFFLKIGGHKQKGVGTSVAQVRRPRKGKIGE